MTTATHRGGEGGRLTFGSLFSGIGGFDLGFERAGMECRWQVEIDKDCGAVLSRHWPGVKRFGDITTLRHPPAVDVLCGGFPCQDLSVAGRRAGLAGERSGLFYEFMRLAAEFRPAWVVIENVPGLLSSNGGRDMGTVLGTLGRLGYGYAYRVLDAQYFGVAQRRRRVFIVGHSRAERAAQVLFEPESCAGDSPPSREAGQRTSPTLEGRAGRSGATNFHTSGGLVAHTLKVNDKGHSGKNYSNPKQEDGRHPLASGARPPLMVRPSVRRLTPVECERLQGFPDRWTAGASDSARYRMLGNAVCVPVSQWIARRIIEAAA